METFAGYGWTATYEAGTLACTFKGAGAFAAGGKSRTFDTQTLTGLLFTPAKMLTNGKLTLGTPVGKTELHFTRKQESEVAKLYEQLCNAAPQAKDVAPVGGYQNALSGKMPIVDKDNEILLANEGEVWVRGVSYRQAVLKKMKKGSHLFEIYPTEYNGEDETAVEVRLNGVVVGFLPGGDIKTVQMWNFGMGARKLGKKLKANGVILTTEDKLIVVHVFMPRWATVKKLAADLDIEIKIEG